MKNIYYDFQPVILLRKINPKWKLIFPVHQFFKTGALILTVVLSFLLLDEAYGQTMSISSNPPHTPTTSTSVGSGVTFNLHAYNSVKITGLTATTQGSGSVTYELWYNTDSVNGSPNISTTNNWVVHETGTAVPGQILTLATPLKIPNGKTYGIFFRAVTASVRYSSTATPVVFQDANLRLRLGSQVGYAGTPPNPTLHPRNYAGTIQYELDISGPNDAGITAIDSPSNYCPGTHSIITTVSNLGTNIIDSVMVNWEFGGVLQTPVHYKSSIDTVGSISGNTAQVNLGSETFTEGVTYDLKVWTSAPNGKQDTVNSNDTLSLTLKQDPSCPLKRDVGVSRVITPSARSCDLTDTTEVCITVRNYGSEPQDSIVVAYRIYSLIVSVEMIPGTIAGGDSIQYCFKKRANLSLPSLYPLTAWTELKPDGKPSNDTLPYFFTIQSDTVLKDFPYLTTFEENPGALPVYWENDAEDGNYNWQFNLTGSPVSNGIPFDHTTGSALGHYAWLDNSYTHSGTNLITPCLDLSGLATPHLEFWYINPGVTLELYVDIFSGGQWITIAGPLGSQSTTDWTYHLYDLKQFENEIIKVRFRGVDASGGSTLIDIAIDDVKIFNRPPFNPGVIDLITPASGCDLTSTELIEAELEHTGHDIFYPGDTIWMHYTVNGGNIITEYFLLLDTIEPYESFSYTFQNFQDFSQPSTAYDIIVWTSHWQDDDFTNDTLYFTLENTFTQSFPGIENFDDLSAEMTGDGFTGVWRNEPTGPTTAYRWNVGTLNVDTYGPYGDHTFGYGNYAYTDLNSSSVGDSALLYNNSCYDLSKLQFPGLNFWYHMDGSNVGDLYLDIYVDNQWVNGIWAKFGEQDPGWERAIVKLDQFIGKTVSFRFRAINASTSTIYNVIAVDDWRIGELPKLGFSDTTSGCGFVELDALTSGGTYLWNDGSQTQTKLFLAGPNDTVNEFVTVEVWSSHGLYNSDTSRVILLPGPYVDLGDDTLVCDTTGLVLNAGNPGMNYVWDDGSNNQTRTVTQDGQYYVAVSSAGCVKADTIDVQFEPIPVAALVDSQAAHSNLVHFSSTGSVGTTYFWDFGDNNYSGSANPDHYYSTIGDYDVMLIVTNDCGSDTITQTVTVEHKPGVGIDLPVSIQEVKIYPNPTDGQFMLELKTDRLKEMGITILNINGQEVLTERYQQIESDFSQRYDLSELAKGVYFIRIHTPDGIVTEKIIIQ